MKYLILFFLSLNISQASVTGVTSSCPEKAQLMANEGDKFVTIRLNGKDEKLTSVSGEAFSLQAKNPVTFRSNNKNRKLGEASLEFEMTSVVMSSLPRLIVSYSGVQNKCMVNLNGSNND